ncbi:hypothetical protein VTJ83DRAFT_7006 [Remersonia thermophila]|uniref:Carrier domain-containing protein n=1 Tax=Remersonia thermophila TaxID=72144 RepID=A0ABR4D287_9PEZI
MASLSSDSDNAMSIVNHPPTRLPGPRLLHHLVQQHSEDGQPAIDFLALDESRASLTYRELHDASDALASRIACRTSQRRKDGNLVVPVLIPQSPELYIALLAILKAGGAFCPMNLDVPPERAKFILGDVAAELVITTSELAPKLPEGGHSVLIVDDKPSESSPVGTPYRQATSADLAYVMYTSGSTGTPKGVGITHDAATQSLLAHDRHIPSFSRFLQFAAPTFDVSVFEIFFPLFRGKTLVACSRPAMLNDLPGVLRKMDVDACELTPSVAGSLLRRRDNAPGLRLLLTIGEMLTKPVIEEFGGSHDRPSMLWAMYGPTEAAIHCTLQPAATHDSTIRNIGIPLDTTSAFILRVSEDGSGGNRDFEVLPRGEIGELAVGGHQLAQGYLNRREQTAAAFIETPYGRLYRTGDKARMLHDGRLECLGRISDGQVKLRGQRMELGEVEHAALRVPGCHSAVAAVMGATLVLFCAADGPPDVVTEAVMESCRQWLPGFMLPGDIIVFDSFPRLASGKVDRKRMIEEYKSRGPGDSLEPAFMDDLERQIHRLTRDLLGVNIQPGEDLAKAGLDSLTAIRLASVLRNAGFEVGALDILESRGVSELAGRLRSRPTMLGSERPQAVTNATRLDQSHILASHTLLERYTDRVDAVMPCTPLQASMLAETARDQRAYCNWVELGFNGGVSPELIRSWFVKLAQANEILRTGFVHQDGQFLQVVLNGVDDSTISICDSPGRQFELDVQSGLMFPFRVSISTLETHNVRRVVLQMHHAVYDGWSLDLLLTDLANLAQGLQLDVRPQFRLVTGFIHSEAFDEACNIAREFWAGALLGYQPPVLPVLNARVVPTSTTESFSFSLNATPETVKATMKTLGCSIQAIFQAAVAWLWSSMLGSEDVVIGTIQSGRTVPITGVETIIGPCIAAVPLRVDLSQMQTIQDLVVGVHAANRATLAHGVLPLAEIKSLAGIPPGQACYDVAFIYQESPHSKSWRTGAFDVVTQQDYLETKLLIEVEPKNDEFEMRLTYHSDVFPEHQIKAMVSLLDVAIVFMAGNLTADLASVRKALPQEHASVYNLNPKRFEGVPDLAHAVDRIANRFPDKDAVCFAEHISDGMLTTTTITFAELNFTAETMAEHIRQRGASEGRVIAIVMEKSIRLYTAILAILKTGNAYLPLLPSTPISRLADILEHAEINICLVDASSKARLEGHVHCHLLDIEALDLHSRPGSTIAPAPDPDRLAYVIYTSGSTGAPKGVCVTQRNVMSNLDALSRIYPVGEHSRLLQSCSQAFDVSVFEIFFAWTQGMCLCSATNDTLFEDLERSIRKLYITHLSMTPTVASLVDPGKVPSVTFLVTAGEPMTEAVARKWGDKLYQGYGPSETTNICSVKRMDGNAAIRHLGWSLDNTSTFVLTPDSLDPVPHGCLGELCFGGDQVAQGYLGAEDLTAAKFINHPLFGRIYRSGDLGRMLPDGSMVIVGRVDDQIKIRGQRVELNEITETIRQSANGVDCATLLLRDHETGSRDLIISYLVPHQRKGAMFHVLEMDGFLREKLQALYHVLESRLPAYMVPSAIVPVSALPATASGKLDRSRLKQIFQNLDNDHVSAISHGTTPSAANDGEWSANELQVAEVLAAALGVEKNAVGRWTPLATLGLDSISAIQVSRQLANKFKTRLPISVILQNPCVTRLARVLQDVGAQGASFEVQEDTRELVSAGALEMATRKLQELGKPFLRLLPCTPLQEAMLIASSGSNRYLNKMLFRVLGDMERLKEAWNIMVARHDILHTCFIATNHPQSPILQVVLADWQAPWLEFELDGKQLTLDDCIARQVEQIPEAIDLAEPALSFAIIRDERHVHLSFVCHHALYDGVAMGKLLEEVEKCVSGCALPPSPSYEQFLRMSMFLPDNTESFWQNHLDGYNPKLTTHLRSDIRECHRGETSFQLDMLLSTVQSKTRDLGISLLALVQSAWSLTLGALFRTDDVCFGNVFNGRSLPVDGMNGVVAPCFNTLPVRMSMTGKRRNIDLMRAFQNANVELLRYQFTPLRRVRALFSHLHDPRLFDTLLLLQQSLRPLDHSLWTLERDDGEMDVPLVCEVTPDASADLLKIKIHISERQALAPGVAGLASDLFLTALNYCLHFPGSNATLASLPPGLANRLDRVVFPLPSHAEANSQPAMMSENWTPTESSVRDVLADISSMARSLIRRQTTIYQLGLDSIGAVRVAGKLRNLGHRVLPSDVIENPTCEKLARFIESRDAAVGPVKTYNFDKFQSQVASQVVAYGIPSHVAEHALPCTPVQSAMMAQFIKSDGRDYFNYLSFELDDDITAEGMADAWRTVSQAYPILRTAIIPVEHDEVAFAMVQNAEHSQTVCVEPDQVFDLEKWRVQAARDAAQVPHSRLWCVALVTGKKRVAMHLAIHHALYDAQSLGVILDALSAVLKGNRVPPKSAPALAVSDIFAMISSATDDVTRFWRSQSDQVVVNYFPVMTPLRDPSREILTTRARSSAPLASLERAVSTAGYTMQAVLQAAWARILSAYLGEGSVVFGVVFSGRSTEGTKDSAFPCLTTLPVIATSNASNRLHLDAMMQYNTALFKQQHQPLSRIQQLLGFRDVKLFDTLLVYQKFGSTGPEARPWRLTHEGVNTDYPVSIEAEPTGDDGLEYRITFFSDVLPQKQATMLLAQFDATVQHLAFRPDGQEADLCQSRPSIHAVLPPEIPEIRTEIKFLHHFVERQAINKPQATALHFVEGFRGDSPIGRAWTYQQLNDNGNKVAHLLLPHVNPGAIVAVYFDKCPAVYFAILGILKAGCGFVALDPSAPRSRNEFILQDSGASVLLTSPERREALDLSVAVPIIPVSEGLLERVPTNTPVPVPELTSDDVCYCLYTSGTTGTPKGCLITHNNSVQCMLAFQHIFEGHWEHDSRWLQFASLHFDVSVLEQYWSWSVGITLVSAPRDLILEDLAGTIARLGVTHIDLTPSLARLLHPDEVPSLCQGVFITGGEALRQEILDVWGSKGVIYNFYGPTEATIGVTVFPRVPTLGRASNIGRQFVNVGSYVLKPGTEQPVLRGGVGELCLSGPLVGKGYLKRDHLTAEKFPTLRLFGERVYRTGDLVRVLHDGCFDFLGRADDQVKLRGQRLEIGEINHTIRKEVEAVKDVATLVVRNAAQDKDVLVSFIVAANATRGKERLDNLVLVKTSDAARICRLAKEACRAKLPGYMVPTYVLQLPFIPLSVNNKAEFKKLRAFFSSLDPEELLRFCSATSQTTKQLSSTGLKIASAISAMQGLDMATITPSSNVFELGIDSISVLRLSRSMKSQGLSQATPMLILQHPLIADLADAIDKQGHPPDLSPVRASLQSILACAQKHESLILGQLGATADEIEYIAPCSPLQQGMIARSATDDAYFNTFQLRIAPTVSSETLRKAWERVVSALPILRTKFVGTPDGHVQVALKSPSLSWLESSLGSGDSTEQVIAESRNLWISRNKDALFGFPEVLLLVTTFGTRLLVLHVFHGHYDGNSFELILDRLAQEYLALSGEKSVVHYPGTPSFLDALCYGPLQDLTNSKPFWQNHLQGTMPVSNHVPGVDLPVTSSRREIQFNYFETLRANLRVTHQALVQAAWVSVLASYASTVPTIGIIVSGRSIALDGAERVVGPLFNTLPFQAKIAPDGSTTWTSLIQQCHNFNIETLPFQHVPLRDIQKWCSGGKALFDTLFSFQREEQPVSRYNDLWTVLESKPNPDYPLALEATLDSSGGLRLLLVSRGKRSDELEEVMRALEEALKSMVQDPEAFIEGATLKTPEQTYGTVLGGGLKNGVVTNGATTNSTIPTGHHEQEGFVWTELASIIRDEVSRLANIDPQTIYGDTSIFGLGLDSIDAIKLSARLKQVGVNVKMSDLMRLQSIKSIVEHTESQKSHCCADGIDTSLGRSEEVRVIAALREHLAGKVAKDDIVLPATPLQESMVVEMVESDFHLYFNHDIMEIPPTVNVKKLKQAWLAVIAGSPILRTRFLRIEDPSIPSAYCQAISRDTRAYIAEVSLNSADEISNVCHAATLRGRKGGAQSDLLQLHFVHVGDKDYLVLSISHALYDGWSLGLIHQHVRAAYEGRYQAQSLESYLGHLQYILFPHHRAADKFWADFLRDAQPTILPAQEANHGQQSVTIHSSDHISSLSTSEITAFCRAKSITMQTLGQACWAAFLAIKTRSLDVTFGTVLSCRDSEALEGLVFPTMNTVAVRCVLKGSVSSWLRGMQDNSNNIRIYQHFPLREVRRMTGGRGPLFNTLCIQQRSSNPTGFPDSNSWVQSVGGSSSVEYPVCVEFEVQGDSLFWRTACDGAYVQGGDVSAMLLELDQILQRLIRSADTDITMLCADEVSPHNSMPGATSMITNGTTSDIEQVSGQDGGTWFPVEQTIREVLSEVSGVPVQGILPTNNIYHLGLDSISAIKVVTLLRKRGVTVAFRDMVKAGSISEIARAVRHVECAPSASCRTTTEDAEATGVGATIGDSLPGILTRAGIKESAVEAALPASAMQVHVLSVWENTGHQVFYPSFTYTLSGNVSVETIANAWKSLVAELPILRTVFISADSLPFPILQVVLQSTVLQSPEPPRAGDTRWHSREDTDFQQPYHSLRVERYGDRWILRLKIHHALYDAFSLPAMMTRFTALCGQVPTHPLEPETHAFDWVAAHRQTFSSTAIQARKVFWATYLAGVERNPSASFVGHGPRASSSAQTSTRKSMDPAQSVKEAAVQDITPLLALCKTAGISLQSLFFAVYAEFLASTVQSGQQRPENVVFGVYLANRTERQAESGVEFWPRLRLVPLRVRLGKNGPRDLVDVAGAIQRDLHAVSVPENVEVGMWEIRDWTGVVVDSFVNFLGVSEVEVDPLGGDVRLEVAKDLDEDGQGLVGVSEVGSESGSAARWPGIGNISIRDVYPDAIDVEVALVGSSMTIGVFGSRERLRDNGAANVIERLVDGLRELA